MANNAGDRYSGANIHPVHFHADSMNEGTSLNFTQQLALVNILTLDMIERRMNRIEKILDSDSIHTEIVKGKRMGVWVDGKLRFQSRDADAIYDYAHEKMNDPRRYNVWVAPVGSFVEV